MNISSYIHKWQIPLAIIAIMIFGFLNFNSSFKMLDAEEKAMAAFEAKNRALLVLEDNFHDMEAMIIEKFDQNAFGSKDLEEIAGKFSEFQEKFIHFDRLLPDDVEHTNLVGGKFLNQIQADIFGMASLVRGARVGDKGELREKLVAHLEKIHQRLNVFREYQLNEEMKILMPEKLKERHDQIFLSVNLMGVSGVLFIIFLWFKNKELEKTYREKEQVLELSEQRMLAMEASSDGIGIVSDEGNLVYMNRALCQLHGITYEERSEYLDKPWTDLYSEKGREDVHNFVYPELYEKGSWFGETRIRRADGDLVDVEMSLTMLPNGKGMIGTARDISQRKKAEQETAELQDQIHQAQKMEAIGRLAGGIAHDFNNILAAINGYAEFLSEDLTENKKLQKFADNILQAGEKARGLIDQMLAFSRRKQSEKAVIDLKAVIDETVFMLKATAPKTIEINVDYADAKPAFIDGDPTHLTHALMNLCVNACDAMEDDHGELTISLMEIEPDEDTFEDMLRDTLPEKDETPPMNLSEVDSGHTYMELGTIMRGRAYYQVSISDTGSGIPRFVMEHIFEPFFTTKSVDKGTGLGMANVHGTLISHQAALAINSVLTEGTTFDLLFPSTDQAPAHQVVANDQKPLPKASLSSLKLLLIDDEPHVLNMMEALLERENIEFESCSSPLDALELIKSKEENYFDLVITDQNMPRMTGLELIEQVSAIKPSLPFIILSGYSHEKLTEIESVYPSIQACLRKPIKKDDLLRIVWQTMEKLEQKSA